MNKQQLILLLFSFIMISLGGFTATAQTGTVSVGGEVAKPFQITPDISQSMKHVTIKAIAHDGKEHAFTGIPLNEILIKAEALPKDKISGKALSKFILVKAADNYQAVIALPEVSPDFTDKTIILANEEDGKPLPAAAGSFQVIIPGEKKQARWVRQVIAINVLSAKE